MLLDDWEELGSETLVDAIEQGYSEGKQLEFKREMNRDTVSHKVKVVSEICSFANSGGGDLVIGIADEEGTAVGLWPKQYDNIDETIDSWVNIIKRNTDPELPQHLLEIEAVSVGDDEADHIDGGAPDSEGFVIVIRVRRSWRAPHRETINNRFYERSPSGKSELDTGAIRRAMFEGEVFVDRANEFRDDRLSAIYSDDVTVPLIDRPLTVIHVIPRNAFSMERVIDPQAAELVAGHVSDHDYPVPFSSESVGGWDRYTPEGYLLGNRREQHEGKFANYVLTFRSGIIESVSDGPAVLFTDNPHISAPNIREALELVLPRYLTFLDSEGGEPPYHVYLSLVGGEGLPAGTQRHALDDEAGLQVLDRDVVRLTPVIVETASVTLDEPINRLMDSLYQASGYPQEIRSG